MPEQKTSKNFWGSRSGLVLLGFFAVSGYFLWTEHRAHLVAGLWYLPFLLLLLCPLLHLFHGHGDHGDSDKSNEPGHDHGQRKSGDTSP